MLRTLALFALLITGALGAPPCRVVTLGDSHTTVEAGFGDALSLVMRRPVHHLNLGLVGARAVDVTRGTRFESRLAEAESFGPTLILVAFGTNEAASRRGADAHHYHVLLHVLHERFPGVPVAFIGPPNGSAHRLPSLTQVRATQSQVARETNTPWIDRGRADVQPGADGIHFTRRGYAALATWTATHVARLAF